MRTASRHSIANSAPFSRLRSDLPGVLTRADAEVQKQRSLLRDLGFAEGTDPASALPKATTIARIRALMGPGRETATALRQVNRQLSDVRRKGGRG